VSALFGREIRSPKTANCSAPWYGYYAGYSSDFATDVIKALVPSAGDILVFDPWNGAGTTTFTAARLGLRAAGSDLNPALTVVAHGRHLSSAERPSLTPLARDILRHAESIDASFSRGYHFEADPFSSWFHQTACRRLRAIAKAIAHLLVNDTDASEVSVDNLSHLAAFFYVALFQTTRDLAEPFRTTNPTWVTVARSHEERLSVRRPTIDTLFLNNVEMFGRRLSLSEAGSRRVRLFSQSAQEARLADSPDVILTSPPYATRIDYVKATLPELAVLGLRTNDLVALRRAMLGTPLTNAPKETENDPAWGASAAALLSQIRNHPSKASGTYYWRYFRQYVDGVSRSLAHIAGLLADGGYLALVVQDSHYKNTHVDLATIATEMALNHGLSSVAQIDFPVRQNMATINPQGRKYRDRTTATESLVVLQA
jgi:hypothetical protein